ncbi:hypothetical protein WJX74_007726 [Apatococcus lobatus]|uniref:Glutamine amidotransferase domain-containing protein n=1 Tax=Apatococcus lobatus TaxID=904363 RepID=A0AAW1RZ24_9CHLO
MVGDREGLWLAQHPGKRWTELFFLAYSPFWIVWALGIVVPFEIYEKCDEWGYMAIGLGASLPCFLLPPLLQPQSERQRPFWQRHWVKANVWIAIFSFIGNYFWTHYFYDLLGASYTFKSWRLNDVPITLYFMTHAYFCFYHTLSNLALRRLRHAFQTSSRLYRVSAMGLAVFLMAYTTAIMETLTIAHFPYYTFRDRQQMYTIGSLFYAIYFWFSFPMYFWMDEDKAWSIWQAIQSSLAAGMGVTILLDFWRLAIGPISGNYAGSEQLSYYTRRPAFWIMHGLNLKGSSSGSTRGSPAWRDQRPVLPGRSRLDCARARVRASANPQPGVTLLDYGAGNVRSVKNALRQLGQEWNEVQSPGDILNAQKLVFPGVGAYEQAMQSLVRQGLVDALREYIQAGRPFLGICLGLQLLFEGSEENGGVEGLGLIPGRVQRFPASLGLPVPHIGWNDLDQWKASSLLQSVGDRRAYFVHSYCATPTPANDDWVLATSHYGMDFVAAIRQGDVHATQFHPEKSGPVGLAIIDSFLNSDGSTKPEQVAAQVSSPAAPLGSLESPFKAGAPRGLAKRVIACLDVRTNDAGDLVVTKGDQYDVREKGEGQDVRNLGQPVELAGRYAADGADEVTFLNITGFRDFPLGDLPMLEVLRQTSKGVFVPLTVGGGIREFMDAGGHHYSALQVAAEYFRSGADKVSIGSDAVAAAEELRRTGQKSGRSAIEQISWHYGAQAVVVSIDPRRVWVADPSSCLHRTVRTQQPGPQGEQHCWWQCTVKGGREGRNLGAVELAQAVEELGAGEILLNCIDKDGAGNGFDLELIKEVSDAVNIPVIASSGAGKPEHFAEVFHNSRAAAALAAGIFHRREVSIDDVKLHMAEQGIPTRTG